MSPPYRQYAEGVRDNNARICGEEFCYICLVVTILVAIVTPTPNPGMMLKFMASMAALYFVAVLLNLFLRLMRKSFHEKAGWCQGGFCFSVSLSGFCALNRAAAT
jgi:hypothetical protein